MPRGTTFGDFIRDEMSRRGFDSFRELEAATKEAAEKLIEQGIPDRGIGIGAGGLSKMTDRTKGTEPDLRSLRLLSMALRRPMRVLLQALGYEPDSYEALSDPRRRTLAMVTAAPDELLVLVDRIIALDPMHRDGVAAFLTYLEEEAKKRE